MILSLVLESRMNLASFTIVHKCMIVFIFNIPESSGMKELFIYSSYICISLSLSATLSLSLLTYIYIYIYIFIYIYK